MNLILRGSVCSHFLFQDLTLYLTTKSYIPQCLASSIWPTKWSWNLNRDPGSLVPSMGTVRHLRAEYKWANVHTLLPPTSSLYSQFIWNFQTYPSQASWKCLTPFRIPSLLFLQKGMWPCLFSKKTWISFLRKHSTISSFRFRALTQI